ncbi:unnamed protein product [Musa banksii]
MPFPSTAFLNFSCTKPPKTQVGGREEEGQESCGKGWQFRTSFKEETLFSTHKHSSGADTSHGLDFREGDSESAKTKSFQVTQTLQGKKSIWSMRILLHSTMGKTLILWLDIYIFSFMFAILFIEM